MFLFVGVRRFYDNLEMMYGWRINPYMMVCWTVLSPIFCMVRSSRRHSTITTKALALK